MNTDPPVARITIVATLDRPLLPSLYQDHFGDDHDAWLAEVVALAEGYPASVVAESGARIEVTGELLEPATHTLGSVSGG